MSSLPACICQSVMRRHRRSIGAQDTWAKADWRARDPTPRRRARSASENPPSGPMRMAQGTWRSLGQVPSLACQCSRHRRQCGGQAVPSCSEARSSFARSATSGTNRSHRIVRRLRSHVPEDRSCRMRSELVKRGLHRHRMRRTPISVAFSTMKSVRAFLIGANSNQRSGGMDLRFRLFTYRPRIPPRLPASATTLACHSPSLPLNRATAGRRLPSASRRIGNAPGPASEEPVVPPQEAALQKA